jgi:hypothetical protein
MKKLLGWAVLASGLHFGVAAFADNHGHDAKACEAHCEKCKHDGDKAEACTNEKCDCHKHDHKHDHKKDSKKKDDKKGY